MNTIFVFKLLFTGTKLCVNANVFRIGNVDIAFSIILPIDGDMQKETRSDVFYFISITLLFFMFYGILSQIIRSSLYKKNIRSPVNQNVSVFPARNRLSITAPRLAYDIIIIILFL